MISEDKIQKIKQDSRSLVSGHEEFFKKLQKESVITVFSLASVYLIPYLGTKFTLFNISNTFLIFIFLLFLPFVIFASHFYNFYQYHSFSSLYFGKKLLTRKECLELWIMNIKNLFTMDIEILYRKGVNTMLTMVLTYLALFTTGFVFRLNSTGELNYLFLTISSLAGLVVYIISRVNYTFSTVIFIDSLIKEEIKSPKDAVIESEKCAKKFGNNEIINLNMERPFSFIEYKSGAYLYSLYRFLISSQEFK